MKFPISLPVIFIAIGGLGVLLLLEYIVAETNFQRILAFGTILAAVGSVGAFLFIGYQAMHLKRSIDLQMEAFSLEKRPYLYVSLENFYLSKGESRGSTCFGGGNLYFRNKGSVPASIIPEKTKYMVASDESGVIGVVEWFDKAAGGFPHVKTVFPGQNDAFVPLHPSIGKNPRLLYIGASVAYSGTKPGETYWYRFSRLYVIKFTTTTAPGGKEVEKVAINPLEPDHDWDRNTNTDPPDLIEPDWKHYLSQSYIKEMPQ